MQQLLGSENMSVYADDCLTLGILTFIARGL